MTPHRSITGLITLALTSCAGDPDPSSQIPRLADGPNGVAGTLCMIFEDGQVACTGVAATPPQDFFSEKRLTVIAELPAVVDVALTFAPHAACAITQAGEVWCWGDNSLGATGRGTVAGRYATDETAFVTPAPVVGLPRARAVVGAPNAFCALGIDAAVFCWGESLVLAPLTGDREPMPTPQRIPGIPPAEEIDSAANHACARTRDGAVWCWGVFMESVERTPREVIASGATAFVPASRFEVCARVDGSLACVDPGVEDPR